MFLNQRFIKLLFAVFVALFVVACSDSNNEAAQSLGALQSPNSPVLDVYKRPTCGCCGKWIAHIKENDFQTVTHNQNNFSALKREKGIQERYQSCHTAISKDGYVFEGHIPAKFIKQFLADTPEGAIGLAVPAMPVGSPGMEVNDKFMPYVVLLLKTDGTVSPYAQVNTQKEQY